VDAQTTTGAARVKELEVLVPRLRRRKRVAELRARCADAGVQCEIRRAGKRANKRTVAILTLPADRDDHAFAELSRWVYVHLGTRPHDLNEAAAEALRRRVEADAARRNTAWTSREFRLLAGRLVRKEFLSGVEAICAATGVRCESRVDGKPLARTIVIVISGPSHAIDDASAQIVTWRAWFRPGPGGG
jgi:hypothetical protein